MQEAKRHKEQDRQAELPLLVHCPDAHGGWLWAGAGDGLEPGAGNAVWR